ncbi:MAG: DUF4215 domain-containing protein [Myxococcales bacterium]|nr:DUF4215 domain-containing protein [Myxococcales bacterium]
MAFSARSSLVLCALVGWGCGDDGIPADPTDGSGTTIAATGGSTTVPEGGTSVTPATGSGSEGGNDESGFDPPQPECGNGYVEADEECDDGNAIEDDACNSSCQVPCGLEWSEVVLGPTLDSLIEGRAITSDPTGQVILSGLLREITVAMDGTTTVADDAVLVQSHMPGGGLVWEQILGDPQGDAQWAGVAVDAAGDVYVASTVDAADGGQAIRVTKLAAADGGVLWVHDFDGPFPGEDEVATGIAVGPDGQPVVAGTARAGDGDDDIWVRKLEAADGSEAWTTTYGGVGSGGFSTDDGGPIAIAADGSIYVLGRIYQDFQTNRGTLLRFAADGGPAQWSYTPTIAGSDQTFTLEAVTVAADGGPLMAVSRVDGSQVSFWLFKLDDAGVEQWSMDRSDFEVPGAGTDWMLEGLATSGDELVVLGRYLDDQRLEGLSWWEPWVSRVSADTSVRCQVLYQAPFDGLLPTSLRAFAVTTNPEGSALVTGAQDTPDESSLWLGSFRD